MATETTERKIHVSIGSKMNIVNRLVPTSGESAKNILLIAEFIPKNSPLLCGGDMSDFHQMKSGYNKKFNVIYERTEKIVYLFPVIKMLE